MKVFVSFVAGLIVGAAGITFSDVAQVADRGLEAATTAMKESVETAK